MRDKIIDTLLLIIAAPLALLAVLLGWLIGVTDPNEEL